MSQLIDFDTQCKLCDVNRLVQIYPNKNWAVFQDGEHKFSSCYIAMRDVVFVSRNNPYIEGYLISGPTIDDNVLPDSSVIIILDSCFHIKNTGIRITTANYISLFSGIIRTWNPS